MLLKKTIIPFGRNSMLHLFILLSNRRRFLILTDALEIIIFSDPIPPIFKRFLIEKGFPTSLSISFFCLISL